MKKMIALLAPMTALALAAAPAHATTMVSQTVPVGTMGNPYFDITGQTPTDDYVTANFGATVGTDTDFDYKYQFFLPLSGVGSGSVSTSSSSGGTFLQITDVIINGKPFSAAAAAAGVSGIPITAFATNTIEIIGLTNTTTRFGTFTGTATFSAVPEPATWATFLLGFGFLGFGLRRRASKNLAAA